MSSIDRERINIVISRLKSLDLAIGLDSLVSSASNFAITLTISTKLGVADLGRFALAFSFFWLVLGLTRAAVYEPMLIFGPRTSQDSLETYRKRSRAAGLSIGLTATPIALLVAIFMPSIRDSFGGMAWAFPLLMLQDQVRYDAFMRRRSVDALVIDSAWLVAFLALANRCDTLLSTTVCWAATGGISGLLYARRSWWPDESIFRSAREWHREHRKSSPFLVAEFLSETSMQQIAQWIIAAFASVATVGTLRGGEALVAPIRIVGSALWNAFIPRASVVIGKSLRNLSIVFLISYTASALGWLIVLNLDPWRFGEMAFPGFWVPVRTVAEILCIGHILSGMSQSCMMVIKSSGAFSSSLQARYLSVPVGFVGTVGGAILWGASGAAFGGIFGQVAGMPTWIAATIRVLGSGASGKNATLTALVGKDDGEVYSEGCQPTNETVP